MCMIFIKPANVEFPSERLVRKCITSNRHGCGFMYNHNRNVYIRKGFFNYETLEGGIRRAEKHTGKTRDELSIVFHSRIATSGEISKHNCHPFPKSRRKGDLRKIFFRTNCGIAHNGVFPYAYRDKNDVISDTMVFILNEMGPETIVGMVNKIIENKEKFQRMAIMLNNGEVITTGSYFTDSLGRQWSSEHYSKDYDSLHQASFPMLEEYCDSMFQGYGGWII